jgi:hypothetical protein
VDPKRIDADPDPDPSLKVKKLPSLSEQKTVHCMTTARILKKL